MTQPPEVHLLMTCCANEEEARKIARALIAEKLAACINILPAQSIYRWQGEVVEERERLLLIKTQRALIARLQERIKELHSYELPEIMSLATATIERGYLGWLEQQTQD